MAHCCTRPTVEAMREIDDPAELAELFGRHRAIHAYGLADLESPFWEASRWFRRGDAAVGIVDLGEGVTTTYAISSADAAGSLVLVAELLDRIPAGTMITGPTGLAETIGRRCEIDDLGPHVKCVLVRPDLLPSADSVVSLSIDDFPAVAALHATDPGAAFVLPAMLADDTFVGIVDTADPQRLVAAAGTHVVSERYDIAAIGAVFVDPEARGRGLGAVVTAGACARLKGRVSTIGLNVDAANTSARRTYERIGFVDCLDYEEIVVGPSAPRR